MSVTKKTLVILLICKMKFKNNKAKFLGENFSLLLLPKRNKGLSEVVATVIIIMLVIIATAAIWSVTSNFINEKTTDSKSCFDVDFSERVVFNGEYTCYNSSSDEVQFSVNIGDVNISKIAVTILAGGSSKSFELTPIESNISGLYNYPSKSASIKMPSPNSGQTYIATGISQTPDWIKIAPYVGDKSCNPTDTIYELEDCSLFG